MRRPWRTWRPAELQQLRSLLGQMPMPLVVEAYNRWAAGEGIPGRSVLSLRRKAHELGLSVCCGGEWVRIGTAARLLRRSRQCIWLWVRQGLVQHRHGALRRSSLVQLASDRPHLFEGCPVEGLAELLRDAALAEQLAADHPKRRARPRCKQAVQRLDTGEVFPSMREAGRACFVSGTAIGKAIKAGRPAAGVPFRLVS